MPYVFLALAVLGSIVLLVSLRKANTGSAERGHRLESRGGAGHDTPSADVLPLLQHVSQPLGRATGISIVSGGLRRFGDRTAGNGKHSRAYRTLGVEGLTLYWLRSRTGLWPHYLQAVYGIPLIALAIHAGRMLLPRVKQLANLQTGFSYAGFGFCFSPLPRLESHVRGSTSRCRRPSTFRTARSSACSGQRTGIKNIKPDDPVLACNPRQMAYLQQSTYSHLVRSAWWDSATKYTEPSRLAKLKIKWVLINLPETKQNRAIMLYDDFKHRTDMREAYSLFNDKGVVLAFFEVLPQIAPSNSP